MTEVIRWAKLVLTVAMGTCFALALLPLTERLMTNFFNAVVRRQVAPVPSFRHAMVTTGMGAGAVLSCALLLCSWAVVVVLWWRLFVGFLPPAPMKYLAIAVGVLVSGSIIFFWKGVTGCSKIYGDAVAEDELDRAR